MSDPIMYTSCLHCRQAVTRSDGRWIHVDGYQECRPTYAAPNFDRLVSEDGRIVKTVNHS